LPECRYRFFRACDFEGLGFGLGLALDLGLEAARFFATGRAGRRGFDFAFVAAVRRALFDGAAFLFLGAVPDPGVGREATAARCAGVGAGPGSVSGGEADAAVGRRSGGSVWI
jgi:hypothetical protein